MYACKYNEAIPFREQAIKLDPFPDGGSYRILGEAYNGAERYEEAVQVYRKALQLSPNDFLAYFGLVRTYARLGRKEEARAVATELLKVNPKFSLDWSAKMALKITATECHSAIYDDIELLRKVDVGLK